jgi:phenylpyruvate tautomerase PptA (4-oxalocrotonate tautomerase family)
MPISVRVTQGLLTSKGEREVLPLVAEALLRVHGLSGNKFMEPNVIGHLSVTPESESIVGGKSQSLAVIEVKVPAITFPDGSSKQSFVAAVTDIVDQLKAGAHPRERTYVNVTYVVDGTWGIAGKAYSNTELIESVQRGAH